MFKITVTKKALMKDGELIQQRLILESPKTYKEVIEQLARATASELTDDDGTLLKVEIKKIN